jgi:hypothetical protein
MLKNFLENCKHYVLVFWLQSFSIFHHFPVLCSYTFSLEANEEKTVIVARQKSNNTTHNTIKSNIHKDRTLVQSP